MTLQSSCGPGLYPFHGPTYKCVCVGVSRLPLLARCWIEGPSLPLAIDQRPPSILHFLGLPRVQLTTRTSTTWTLAFLRVRKLRESKKRVIQGKAAGSHHLVSEMAHHHFCCALVIRNESLSSAELNKLPKGMLPRRWRSLGVIQKAVFHMCTQRHGSPGFAPEL